MAKKQNFEILSEMAAQNKNIRMSTILVSANKNGENVPVLGAVRAKNTPFFN